ncbi:MAG TPA: MG2 domain-containing protein, partial [Flavisolibacter sp.]|nr:MG2 domain-containing protein [Flavisolibacter sp.]
MYTKFPAALLLWCSIIFLFSCSTNKVSLDYTNAKGEVPQLSNLVFRFNKGLFPDSLLNNWDSSDYVSFSPKIDGRFRWSSPDELVFSPAQPLLPATTYKAVIKEEVLRYSKFDKVETPGDVQFHTSSLQLDNAQVTWVLHDEVSRTALPQVSLQFNYAVKADALKERIKLQVEGKDVPFQLQTSGTSKNMVLRLNNFRAEDKNYELQLSIDKGLKPEKGENATKDAIKTLLTIPSPFVLNINNIESEHDGSQGVVHIYTSQQLTGEGIQSYIRFQPAVAYATEFTDFGVTLRSDRFSSERSYTMTIAQGLRGRIGGVLKEAYNNSVAFGELESSVQFTNGKAMYLSKNGGGNIEVRITNTPKIKVIVSKIYENNLLMANRYGYEPKDGNENEDAQYAAYREEGEHEDYSYSYADAMAGDVIYSKELDTRSLPKTANGGRLLNLSQIEDRLPEVKGIYHVLVRSKNDYWVRDSRLISFSDIGLIAKEGSNQLFVFANSIKSTQSISGVTLSVYGLNNQLIGTGSTSADGVAEIKLANNNLAGNKPAMVVAKTADDFSYLPFHNTKVNLSRFDVGGKRRSITGFDAFVYPERDIYRPGERINFSVILRDREWQSPGEVPLKFKMLMPNGKELKTFRKSCNEQGATEGSVDLSMSAITGSYTLEVYSSTEVLLASKSFSVEEFVPDRLKVSAQLDAPALRPGQSATLNINAVNFFGPPAANRNVEAEIQVKQKTFSSKKYTGYDFTLANQTQFYDKEVKEGKTDPGGNASFSYDVPSLYANTGLL